jgi:hypothetical protein
MRLVLQGRLRCLGSSSHLKLRFGGGFLLEVHAADDDAAQARLAAYVARELGGTETEDRHFSRAKFRLPARGQVRASKNTGTIFRDHAARTRLGEHLTKSLPLLQGL